MVLDPDLPVPDSATTSLLTLAASLETVKVALCVPRDWGSNSTSWVHDAPAASGKGTAGQVPPPTRLKWVVSSIPIPETVN